MKSKNKLYWEMKKPENKDQWVTLVGKNIIRKPINGDTLHIDFFELLTERQQEIFKSVVSLGHYDYPRRMSLSEMGKDIGISPSTLCTFIQKIESKMVRFFYDENRSVKKEKPIVERVKNLVDVLPKEDKQELKERLRLLEIKHGV